MWAATSTGALLEDLGTGVVGQSVATEIAGLNLTVNSITTNGASEIYVAAGTRAGVGDNFFRAGTPNDSITFSFDQAVEITELTFGSFTGTESIVFAGETYTASAANIGAILRLRTLAA